MVTLEKHNSRQKMSVYLGQDSSTPLELAQEMISKIPLKVLRNTKSRFLDPCAGTGTFLVALFHELKKYHSEEHILTRMLHACEVDKFKLRILKNLGVRSIYEGSYFEKEFSMKFDIIIGNPPYNSTSGGKKLWPLFSTSANRLLKENGNLLFVTPNTWLSRPHSPKMKAMVELCSSQSLHLIDTTASKYFPNIGEDIGYWMVSNTNRKRNTTVVLNDKTKEVDYVGQVIAMSESDELKNDITSKIRLSKSQNWHHRDYTMSHKIHIENNQLSEVKSEEFDTPVLHTASKVLYGRNIDVTQSWKLIINNSGYYSSKTELDKYQKVTNEYGVGLGTYGLLVESKEQALNARSFFNSKAYRFVIEENKTSGFNTEVKYLPLLDVNKSWTDKEIYAHFNLTQEEIDLIESTVAY